MATILVVEDNESMARMLCQTLSADEYKVILCTDTPQGVDKIQNEYIDLVLTDLRLPSGTGIDILSLVREQSPFTPVILMTAFGKIEDAVRAVKEGAYDFITKPFDPDHLLLLIKRALEKKRLLTENLLLKEGRDKDVPGLIGHSPKFMDALHLAHKVAPSKATVLLSGESGTGKEVFARTIHYLSLNKDGPFVAINCAAIPKELLESELFGHEKGSFTGATEKRIGKFELANRGTIFLDEIGEMDLGLQAKLLRVLQGDSIERVGGTKKIEVDVRVIAASNRNLNEAINDKSFREDLYYRLTVFPITLPPLRERREDIPLLAYHFISTYNVELKKHVQDISGSAMELLIQQTWKGNIRELGNCLERAMILCDGNTILPEHLGLLNDRIREPGVLAGGLAELVAVSTRSAEIRAIKSILELTKGNKSKAAEILKVSYKTLLTKIKGYGIH
ncbi:MAG: sigma-54-dependent Fis family transcriptional regulator [Nitrospirae bacterium]|nr:sigma-54-dependent Fis family transcriptional regulator [Nitrospirota bacterium]